MTFTNFCLVSALIMGNPGGAGGLQSAVQGTKPIPAATVNPLALHGFLHQPAYSIDKQARFPLQAYQPQPGDLLLLSDPTPIYTFLYTIALTGRPGHGGLVVPLPDGQLGLFEAGWNDTTWTRISPLEWRINEYPGTVWVRRRIQPLTERQLTRMQEFTQAAANQKYNIAKFASQVTPFRCRGPLRTWLSGKPKGPGGRYFCAQALLEALVYAEVIDDRTSRPAATYPEDLFFDDSRNLYIRRHPPLVGAWCPPSLWTRCPDASHCNTVIMPYSAFDRAGVYHPPSQLISIVPPKPNPR